MRKHFHVMQFMQGEVVAIVMNMSKYTKEIKDL